MSTQTEIELFPSHRDYYEMLKKDQTILKCCSLYKSGLK